jgi:ribonuclease P/MRP protein subunit POP5
MVRFKNRHLLVEFLTPSQLTPTLSIPGESQGSSAFLQIPNAYDEDDEDDDGDVLPPPALPFLVPSPGSTGRLEISDDAGGAVYRAVRKVVQDVFGDEGWGRVASSFKGEWDILLRYSPFLLQPPDSTKQCHQSNKIAPRWDNAR